MGYFWSFGSSTPAVYPRLLPPFTEPKFSVLSKIPNILKMVWIVLKGGFGVFLSKKISVEDPLWIFFDFLLKNYITSKLTQPNLT